MDNRTVQHCTAHTEHINHWSGRVVKKLSPRICLTATIIGFLIFFTAFFFFFSAILYASCPCELAKWWYFARLKNIAFGKKKCRANIWSSQFSVRFMVCSFHYFLKEFGILLLSPTQCVCLGGLICIYFHLTTQWTHSSMAKTINGHWSLYFQF